MAVEFTCPMCSGTLRVGDGPPGRLVRCGGCLTLLKVPNAPPLDPQDDATTDALHTRVELLPVAHPVSNTPPVPAPKPTRRPLSPAPAQDAEDSSTPRGKGFWLSISLLAFGLGMCGCCGLAAVVLPPPEWQNHKWSHDKGGFKVDLPGEPQHDMANRVKVRPGREHKGVEGMFLWTRAENYIIAYRDLKDLPKSEDEFLDAEVEVITSDKHIIVQPIKRSEKIEVQGFPGREFEYEFKNGGVVTGRVILAGKRVYILVAGGQFTDSGTENVRRFLESFEITDPNLLAIVKKRADAKKQDDTKKKPRDDDPNED
ncbi:MAG: hypothetical protein K8U57_31805 [Planctomycetes bacterium]|nr:hypothetical protein [Planctomycetota bacterium]